MRALPIIAALLAFTSCAKPEPQPANRTEASDQAGLTKGVDRSQKGKPAPDAVFNDPDGGEISLAEFAGSPVLVNLWATWCAPCIKELPTLDRLAADRRLDGRLGVIAVSQDSGPQVSVDAFLDKLINWALLVYLVESQDVHHLAANFVGAGVAAIWNFSLNNVITWRE